jgi:hypothetical protein
MINTTTGSAAGRRRNARARLNIPARLVLLDGQCSCTIENISREGARVVTDHPLKLGDQGILRNNGLDQFFTVHWVRDGHFGLNLDDPIAEETILELRRLADNFESHRQAGLREIGREWVEGRSGSSIDG